MLVEHPAQGALLVLTLISAGGPPGRPATEQPRTEPVLTVIADVPLPGRPGRFDYQSLDHETGRLYIAHMATGELIAFDTRAGRVVGRAGGLAKATGVLAVPALHRVYVSAAGGHRVVVLEAATLRRIAAIEGISFPDGLAFAPPEEKVFVSDELGQREIVIDARSNHRREIGLSGEAGNTQYDAVGRQLLVAVQTRNELVSIDPRTERITGRYRLPGADHPHGVLVDSAHRLAFVANEGNGQLLVIDLKAMRVIAEHRVGKEPDVLAFDPGLRRLYVASESGVVTVFSALTNHLVPLGTYAAPHAHSVAVDPATHRVYLPLADVAGRPVLRVLTPADSP